MVRVKIYWLFGTIFRDSSSQYARIVINWIWVTLKKELGDPERLLILYSIHIQLHYTTYLFSSFQHVTMNWSGCRKYASWTTSRFWIYPTIILNSWMDWKSLNFFLGSVWLITKSRLFSNWINVFILNI